MMRSDNFNTNFLHLKLFVFLALAGGIGFYSLTSSAMPSPLDAARTPEQERPDVSSAPLPEDLPKLKPGRLAVAAPPAATGMPSAIGSAKEDPLAWDNSSAPQGETAPSAAAPLAAAEAPKMPAAAVKAVEKVETARGMPEDSAASQEKNRLLEKRIMALEEAVSSLKTKNADLESLEVTVGELQQKVAAEKSGTEATVQRKAKVAAPRKAHHPVISASRWVLKAAKPGIAWVAKRGSNEIRAVAVGENLTGIGKIKAVTKDSAGRWTVSGTKGRIDQ